ncbi:three component ABC system middle component [Methylobacterium indicum]|uniref:three component ABC system middle component n=1 Tax=Methylobacterium indicum TaxID=1775910 RepID=UPI0009E62280|nr:three component ABC system middle component [Methylobacterium indicum]
MKNWSNRPVEIRNLFNPAFCGLVIYQSMISFSQVKKSGMPFSVSLLILPLCLHRDTREVLQEGKRSYFLKIVAENPIVVAGLADRCTNMLPFSFEALGLLAHINVLSVSDEGSLLPGTGVRKSIKGSEEMVACQRVAAFLGKEFGRIGDRSTIYATLGLRP